MEQAMRKMITILATGLLASSLAIAQADARGGGGGGGHGGGMGGGFGGGAHMAGGFGGGAHIGGFGGGAHVGGVGIDSVTGFGATHIGGGVGRIGGSNIDRFEGSRTAVGENARVGDVRQHAMHRLDRIYPYYGYGVDCYDWSFSHPADTEPPYCG
jgi:hypothetical protein